MPIVDTGNLGFRALHTPEHTPEHMTYLVADRGGGATEPMAAFTGDFIFVGNVGRPDLLESAAGVAGAMEPSARRLYHSLRKFAALPGCLQILPAHGAGSACGKALGAVPQLDVRRATEFAAGHVRGAQNLAHTRLRVRLDEVPTGPLVVHCATGLRAVGAASMLESTGRDVACVNDSWANCPASLR